MSILKNQLTAKAAVPKDGNMATLQLVPPTFALAVTNNSSISSEVEVTLQAGTSIIEISALSQGIFMKYKLVSGGTPVSSSNFDEYIQAGLTRNYQTPPGVTVVSFIQQAATATLIMIEK